MFSPAALTPRASTISHTYYVSLCPKEHINSHSKEELCTAIAEGSYPVPFRTRKSSPPASTPVLWCESPWERSSLCHSPSPPRTKKLLGNPRRFDEDMPISTGDILGHQQVGVYISIVGDVLFLPSSLDKDAVEEFESAFDLEAHQFLVGGSALLGSLIRGNRRGIAVADIASQDDLDELTSFGDVVVMESGVNAAGNLIECNDKGALVSPTIPSEGAAMISEVLGVDVARTEVAGHKTVGSMVVANNKGALTHPDVKTAEVEVIESTLAVPAMVGTVTFGSPFVGAGCVANDSHALAGTGSTGPELNRIEDALGLI